MNIRHIEEQYVDAFNPEFSPFMFSDFSEHTAIDNILPSYRKMVDLHTVCPNDDAQIFIKFAPLVDPIKFITGKYKNVAINTLSTDANAFPKLVDVNNASYVDCLFYAVSSSKSFLHAVEFHGTSNAVSDKFKFNITDDYEHVCSYPYFNDNMGKTHSMSLVHRIVNEEGGTCTNKHKLRISETEYCLETDSIPESCPVTDEQIITEESDDIPDELLQIDESLHTDTILPENKIDDIDEDDCEEDVSNHTDADFDETQEWSDCDENDDEDEEEEENENVEEDEENEDDDANEMDLDDENEIVIYLHNFPTQLIYLEKCKNTLSYLFENEDLTDETASSALFQIIATLVHYQKQYNFTHNDLHTNNVMFVDTEYTHIQYEIDGTCYKVPTYGRIFKIIDFGRSIFTYDGTTYCSDSFERGGDAQGQYNFGQYFDSAKPLLEPNPSFDLCRLACSIYDYIIGDDIDEPDNQAMLRNIIHKWCTMDNGKNILYTADGNVRYDGFTIYRKIATNVHNCLPINQLDDPLFSAFKDVANIVIDGEKITKQII